MIYFLCIGTNLGDRRKNLAHAISLLEKEGIEILKVSSLYETQPVDIPSQPWFYNQVIEIRSNVNPMAFLALIKKIERKIGRMDHSYKGPRIIDIDILMVEKTVVQTKELKIPHPRMEKRNFVLLPFVEISPDAIHPIINEKIIDLLNKSNDHSIVKQVKVSEDNTK